MIDEEVVIKQFASYCRKILKYEKIDYYRERKYRAEHELHLEMFEDYEMEMFTQTSDTYYFECFDIMGHKIMVDNEQLEQALKKLPEKYLQIVLMYHYIGLNDAEIGKIFHRSRSTICDQRHRAVKMLHKFMEGAGNE